jgi:hypothetical protein
MIDTGRSADGFQAACQGQLVNLLNREGSDDLYPDRGTDIQSRALNSQLYSPRAAEHAGNIAASDCLFFHRRTTLGPAGDKIEAVELQLREINLYSVSYGVAFTSVDGRSLSFSLTDTN